MTYTDLISPSHRDKPDFVAVVEAVTDPVKTALGKIAEIPADFDLDSAIGAQLDVLGQWIGRSRYVFVPIVRYWLSLGIADRGLNQGEWFQNAIEESSVTALDDETYRLLLRAKILANRWDGTAQGAVAAYRKMFGPDAMIFIDDPQSMAVTFCFAGVLPSALMMILFARGYIPLKAGGVGTLYRVTSISGSPIFGLGVNNSYVGGLGYGALAVDPETFFT